MATLVDIEQLKRNIREIESSSVYEETSLAEEESKAFKKILKLASIREQASKKLHERLIKDGFSEQAVSNALGRAIEAHIVDDERYAEAQHDADNPFETEQLVICSLDFVRRSKQRLEHLCDA